MRAIVCSPLVVAACCVLSACSPGPGAGSSPAISAVSSPGGTSGGAPETEDQKILNALGQALAQNIVPAGLSEDEPATFPLTGVIPCWTEGLQRIGVGTPRRRGH